MSTFAYAGCDALGVSCRGWIDAPSSKRARFLLAEQGILTESLQPVSAQRRLRLHASSRERLYRELGALVDAGLPLEQALGILMKGADPALCLPAAALREQIREGGRVAQAFAAVGCASSTFELAALEAAERSGNIASTFLALANVLDHRRQMHDRLVSAVTYPLFVCALGVLVAAFMSFFMAPRALDMLQDLQGSPPARARAVVFTLRLILLGGGACALCLWPLLRFARSRFVQQPGRRSRLERRLYGLPGFCRVLESLWASRFAAALAMLSRSGAMRVDALALAGAASGSAWVAADAVIQADAVRQGAPLSRAISAIPPLRRALSEWARIGESGGCLDDLMEQASERLRQDFQRRLSGAMSLLEPILILVIGVFVLAVALAVLLPLLTVARNMAM